MKSNKIPFTSYLILALVVLTFSGCGGSSGDNGGIVGVGTTPTVSGVASSGAPMIGPAFLKDSANNPEINTKIDTQTGKFSFDVSGKTAPYMLRAGTLYSISNGPGTANINPLSHLMVSDAAGFTNMSSMNTFYNNPNGTIKIGTISGKIDAARLHLQQKLAPLLTTYGIANVDPIGGSVNIGQGMDRMFDDVKMTIDASGNVSMMYVNGTSSVVYTGPMASMSNGNMISGNIVTPATTPANSGIIITPSVAKMRINDPPLQFKANIPVTWSVVTPNGGSITPSGIYTAPSVQGMFLVKATSNADPTKSSTAIVQMGSGGMMM